MLIALVLIVLAIVLGVGGIVFTALKWLFIIAGVLFIAGILSGFLARRRTKV